MSTEYYIFLLHSICGKDVFFQIIFSWIIVYACSLKEWPAFFALKKTIDDFNDMCPLLELMANKAMKPRHWQRIMEVTKYIFELDNEDFCLKNILEAPLLPNKEDIEVKSV